MSALLRVNGLTKRFKESGVLAVRDVSFSLERGRTLGVVGESGCGKSTLAKLVLRLLPCDGGEIFFEGRRVEGLGERELKVFRRKVQIIFQEPFLSLDPRMRVDAVLKEPFWIQGMREGRSLEKKVKELLGQAGLPPSYRSKYPRELSGGECQRAAIARALALDPELLVCDEPVSSLDALVRVQILNLLLTLQKERKVSYLFITHDLRVARHISDDILVMKDGEVCEHGPREEVFGRPKHSYTRMLLENLKKIS
ncbi:MAG: ABC transporter ATP-binding protein [Candidatus Omnitrophica bacterium]|nr:ABC transporter ATP-binding protein [Candidatus Omnitrophota bacterium]